MISDRWSNGMYNHDLRRAARVKELRVLLQEASPSNKSNSLTFSVASSLVCTSKHSAESAKTWVLAFVISIDLSQNRVVDLHVSCLWSIVVRPVISVIRDQRLSH